jgi:GxxExxY protein
MDPVKENTGKFLYPDLSYKIVGLAMEVHRKPGPGFLEKVYENALMVLLRNYLKTHPNRNML